MAARSQPSVKRALDDSLRGLDTERRDGAIVALAKRYAVMIDADPTCMTKVGPLLLDALRDLRMTPRSRASVVKGDQGAAGKRRLDEVRARRERRTAAMDPSTT